MQLPPCPDSCMTTWRHAQLVQKLTEAEVFVDNVNMPRLHASHINHEPYLDIRAATPDYSGIRTGRVNPRPIWSQGPKNLNSSKGD